MNKLIKIRLQNAVVLENSEMKQVLGGSGSSGGDSSMCGGSGYTHICECSKLTMVELKQVPSILIVGDMVVVDLFNLKIFR